VATGSILRTSAALGLVEAAHDGQGDWQDWAGRLIDAAGAVLTCSFVNLGVLRRAQDRYEIFAGLSSAPGLGEQMLARASSIAPDLLDPFSRLPSYVATMKGILEHGEPPPEVAQFVSLARAMDMLGLVGVVDEYSVSLGAVYSTERLRIPATDRRLLLQLALHLEAGLRLRLKKGSEVGVLRPDGLVLHAQGGFRDAPKSRAALTDHVTRVERTRTRRQRTVSTAADAWSVLVAGQWGIVERTDSDGKRHYVVVETYCAPRLKALTPLETQVTELSARGLTGKAVAYALGLTTPTVSRALYDATLKLGLGSRTELVGLAARLLGTPRAAAQESSLTAAERDVLALVRMGHTNAAIATARKRSERTVANQVASLLKKLDAPSRRALASAG
jgi:DNA-binding CsgD family transcriptional regulator